MAATRTRRRPRPWSGWSTFSAGTIARHCGSGWSGGGWVTLTSSWGRLMGSPITTSAAHLGPGSAADLLCPGCGQQNLHHGRVTVFDRDEDAETTTVSVVDDGLVSSHRLPSDGCGNPSSRRHGIAIAFECELCAVGLELTIAQHKGMTAIEWRFAPGRPSDLGHWRRDETRSSLEPLPRLNERVR